MVGALIFVALLIALPQIRNPHGSYIATTNAQAYDFAMAKEQCTDLSTSADADDYCDIGPLRWVRLDRTFYRKPHNVYPTDRRELAELLHRLLILKPRIIAVDFLIDGSGKSDPVYEEVADYLGSCRRGGCATTLVFSRSLGFAGDKAVWSSTPLQKFDDTAPTDRHFYFGHVDFDEDDATGYGRTMRPIEVACTRQTACASRAYLSFPALVHLLYARDAAARVNMQHSLAMLHCANEVCSTAFERALPTTISRTFRNTGFAAIVPTDYEKRYIDYAFDENLLREKGNLSLSRDDLYSSSAAPKVRNAVVLVGASSDGLGSLQDVHATPLGIQPGIVMILNATNTVFHGGMSSIGRWAFNCIWIAFLCGLLLFDSKLGAGFKIFSDLLAGLFGSIGIAVAIVLLKHHYWLPYALFPLTILIAGAGYYVGTHVAGWRSNRDVDPVESTTIDILAIEEEPA